MRVLILVGSAGSGKDTAAEILRRRFGAPSVAMAAPLKVFAEGVFDFSHASLWGSSELRNALDPRYADPKSRHWSIAARAVAGDLGASFVETFAPDSWGDAEKYDARIELEAWFLELRAKAFALGLSPRLVLQTLGTDYGRRVFGPDVWIDHALDEAERRRVETAAPFATITDGSFPNEPARVRERGAKALRLVDPEGAPITRYGGHESETSLARIPRDAVDALVVNDKRRGLREFESVLVLLVADLFGLSVPNQEPR